MRRWLAAVGGRQSVAGAAGDARADRMGHPDMAAVQQRSKNGVPAKIFLRLRRAYRGSAQTP